MTFIPLQVKDDFEHSKFLTQIDVLIDSPVNHALIAVAQEVAELLQQAYLFQGDDNPSETSVIRAIEPQYRQIITVEP